MDTNTKISIIAAVGRNRELGKNNKLLWHIPEDMKRFKELTSGHAVIMGRKTFESIGRPLPHRTNIIVTRDPNFNAKGCIIAHSLDEALRLAPLAQGNNEEVFVIGGGQIYEQALPFTHKLYLTVVDAETDADTFFPNYSDFKKIIHQEKKSTEGLTYTFLELEK